jgi:GntP family gluconate:H+ symporter
VLIQTAQGSRVVTAIVTSSIISGNASMMQLSILPLMLMMAAGTLIFSYVTDPYFWLIRRTTGDTVKEVVYSYTLPLASLGILLLMGGLILDIFLF